MKKIAVSIISFCLCAGILIPLKAENSPITEVHLENLSLVYPAGTSEFDWGECMENEKYEIVNEAFYRSDEPEEDRRMRLYTPSGGEEDFGLESLEGYGSYEYYINLTPGEGESFGDQVKVYVNGALAGTLDIQYSEGYGGYLGTFEADVQIQNVQRDSADHIHCFRLYNPNSGEHFYTANKDEAEYLDQIGWTMEGTGWTVPDVSVNPVYRLYNPYAQGGDHHYTMDENEKNTLVRSGWNDEGISFYAGTEYNADDAAYIYREYNPNQYARNHNYTISEEEHRTLISLGWQDEGMKFTAFKVSE